MASSINASTTAGVVTTADTSGMLNIQTAGTTAIAIDASQAVTFAGAVSLSGNQTTTGNLTVNGNTTLGDASTDTILMTGAPSIGGAGLGMGMGFRNRIINGAMVIDQRGASTLTQSTANQFGLDRFDCTGTVSSKVSFVQSSVAPSGFINSTLITSLSAYSVLTGDFFVYRQRIEGLNCSDLGWGAAGAATVTVSFWVRSSLTGSFGGYLGNGSLNRSYPFSYTINAANTWEQKTATIAGDTTGTWLTTNGSGIEVGFSLGAGSTYSGTANTWAGSFYVQPTSSTSVVGTNGATFYITGVQLEKGATATSFDYRPIGTELALCQRYCVVYGGSGNYDIVGLGWGVAGTLTNLHTSFPVQMRTTPTFSYSGSWQNSDGTAAYVMSNLVLITASTSQKTGALEGTSSTITLYRPYRGEAANSSASRAIYSAEL